MTLVRHRGPGGMALIQTAGAHAVRSRPYPEKFGTASVVTPTRARLIADRIGGDPATDPIAQAWERLMGAYTLATVGVGPYNNPVRVPNVYTNPTENAPVVNALRYDGLKAYNFALRYAVTGDTAAAEKVASLLAPWTVITGWIQQSGDDTRLSWCTQFVPFLAAASLVRGHPAWTAELDAAMVSVARRSLTGQPGSLGMQNANNQGDWGVYYRLAAAAFSGDRAAFDATIQRWKDVLEESIDANGDPHHEIYRQGSGQGDGSSGLWYSSFTLTAKTYTAELARVNGVWLYDYETPSGHTLRALWERVGGWLADPASFPYNSSGTSGRITENIGSVEILQAMWPTPAGEVILGHSRPMHERYGMPYTSVTHPGLRVAG